MDYTRNEDKLCPAEPCNYNHIWLVEEISEESGPVQHPVTLEEVKTYLRLEGFVQNSTGGAVLQEPINLVLDPGETTVQSALLIGEGVVLASVAKSGTLFSIIKTGVPGNGQVLYDSTTGELTFAVQGNGEPIDIVYGVQTAEGISTDEFDYDDDLINEMIAEATLWVEKYTGVYLRPVSLLVVFTNGAGMLELPGPVSGTITYTNDNNSAVDGVKVYGTTFPKISTQLPYKTQAAYTAGYDAQTIPEGLKLAVLAYIAQSYEQRGDQVDIKYPYEAAARKARPYRRASKLFA